MWKIEDMRLVVIIFSIGMLVGCGANPTHQDQIRLDELRKTYGTQYRFVLETDTYIRAISLTKNEIPRDEAIAMYKMFWFANGKRREDTNYVYLNFYGKDAGFLYQIAWDPQTKDFGFSKSDHY